MNLLDIITGCKGRFLMLGYCEPELSQLIEAKWRGIVVAPIGKWGTKSLTDAEYYGSVQYIEGHLSDDPHFIKMIQGYSVKPLTVRDIFDYYGGERFDMILIKVEMMTRHLWQTDQIQVHMPKYHLIEDDGYNQAVIKQAESLGYASRSIEGGWLLMGK